MFNKVIVTESANCSKMILIEKKIIMRLDDYWIYADLRIKLVCVVLTKTKLHLCIGDNSYYLATTR